MDYSRTDISPLVKRAEALEQLQRVQQYLFGTTYGDRPAHASWSQWYADIQDAVQELRTAEQLLRIDIAKRLGATINEHCNIKRQHV
jgi:hypothetical protein